MPKLLLKFRDSVIQEIPLRKPCTTVGRIADNDIVINNLGVSRVHARIVQEGDEYFVEDMESRNATLLNNQEVKRNKLKDKDEIGIGKHILVFVAHGEVSDAEIKQQPLQKDQHHGSQLLSPEETLQLSANVSTKKYSHSAREITANGVIIKEAGVQIVDGGVNQTMVKFDRVLVVAGKGPSVDIRIKGTYEKDVVFVVSNRPSGFFVSPPKGIVLKVNGQDVKDYLQLQDGDVIEAAETKMKFFLQTKPA